MESNEVGTVPVGEFGRSLCVILEIFNIAPFAYLTVTRLLQLIS